MQSAYFKFFVTAKSNFFFLVVLLTLCSPSITQAATSIDEKLFLGKLLKHIAPHVCSVKDPYGEGGDNAAKPTKVDFRDTFSLGKQGNRPNVGHLGLQSFTSQADTRQSIRFR